MRNVLETCATSTAAILEVLHEPRLETAEGERADDERGDGGERRLGDADPVRPRAGDDGLAAVLHDARHRVVRDQPLPPRRYHAVEVDDWRQPEADLHD